MPLAAGVTVRVGLVSLVGLAAACGRTDLWVSASGSTGETNHPSSGATTEVSLDGGTSGLGPTTGPDGPLETAGPAEAECGNGLVEEGEQCDPGDDDIGPESACVPGCRLNVCGDGMPGPTEGCDDANEIETDACSPVCTRSYSGDGIEWEGREQCDDADDDDHDACHNDCSRTRLNSIALGGNHSCARLDSGALRCWGNGNNGRTGQGTIANIGDDEPAGLGVAVRLGAAVEQLATGLSHTCARDSAGRVRCFGRAAEGQLGYGNVEDIGDDEPPDTAGFVSLPERVVDLGVRGGSFHTCVIITGGAVRCWGLADGGRLGVPGLTGALGDDEPVASVPPVDVGGTAVRITTGAAHTCALLEDGSVRCWGANSAGQLGYGVPVDVGDDEAPAGAGPVPLADAAVHVSAGFQHTCALLQTGQVQCWGRGNNGRLGYGNTAWVGISNTPQAAGVVDVGGPVMQLEAGNAHTCALLTDGNVRCWGWAGQGQLGYGNTEDIGDDEPPASAGDVPVGGRALQIAADGNHSCALLEFGELRCWGNGGDGRLGYGDIETVGDDETPAEVGDVPVLL